MRQRHGADREVDHGASCYGSGQGAGHEFELNDLSEVFECLKDILFGKPNGILKIDR